MLSYINTIDNVFKLLAEAQGVFVKDNVTAVGESDGAGVAISAGSNAERQMRMIDRLD